jgi:hypothetical protein
MESKHTWRWQRGANRLDHIGLDQNLDKYLDCGLVDNNGEVIIPLRIDHYEMLYDGFWIKKEHRDLIAAAPELLEALKAFLDMYVQFINSGDAGNWNPETDDEVIQARAAIAKAEKE